MKSKLLVIIIISLSLFLSGCGFDESLETNQQHDGDDINVVQNVWPQALEKVFQPKNSVTVPASWQNN